MPSEKRTRVEIFIPVRTDSTDYQTITDWLAEELAYACGGSTLTTPFTRLYTSISQSEVIRDSIHVLFCDFDLDADNPNHRAELTNYLEELRLLLMEALREGEVWIAYHPIARVSGG